MSSSQAKEQEIDYAAMFSGCAIPETPIAQNCANESAQFSNSPNPKGIAQGALNSPPLDCGELRTGNSLGLFGEGLGRISELELEERQLTAAIMSKTAELTAYQIEQGPWWDLWRETTREHERRLEEEGFRLGGEQAAFRRAAVAELSAIRSQLAPAFVNASRVSGQITSLKNRLRSTQTEIKIVKAKAKRKSK